MNVLSLFDGMSCGRIALERAGIEVDNYYSSEIDKYAIQVADKNYPQDIKNRLGDVCNVSYRDKTLKNKHWEWESGNIDLLIGGSPCQGFSFAGKRLNFEDPRSKLFFEYVRLLKEIRPKYFLLENVPMKKESEEIISKELKCKPVKINSSLVSAQNRERLYWTNIEFDANIKDKGLILKDILENIDFNLDREKYSYKKRNFKQSSICHHVGTANFKGGNMLKRVYSETGKAPTLTTISGGCQQKKISNNNGR